MSLSTSSISMIGPSSTMTSTSGKHDRVKVAIQPDQARQPNVQPLLMDFEHSIPLTTILKDVCTRWEIPNHERFSFSYTQTGKDAKRSGKFGYVTEENRLELKNGDILCITLAPSYQAQDIYDKVHSGNRRSVGIAELTSLSQDYTFAVEFISLKGGNGIQSLLSMVEQASFESQEEKKDLANVLGAFQELMEHGVVSWDTVGEKFVKKVINFLNLCRDHNKYHPLVVTRCLGVLESIVSTNTEFYGTVVRDVPPHSLIAFIEIGSLDVINYSLSLINALILKSQNQREILNELNTYHFSRTIHDHILQKGEKGLVDRDIAHQLAVYQSFILNLVEGRMRTPFKEDDEKMEESLRLLPTRAFADEYRNKSPLYPISENHWKQLGFSQANPRADFQDTPPGVLALDCMEYLARNKHEIYTRLLFAQMDNPCPFAQTSIALTKVLCLLFRIGEQSEIGYFSEFIPLMILNEEPFKEIFCVTIQLLFKTWREMRAGIMDLEKVTAVVTKQITTVLQSQDINTLTSAEGLKTRLFELSYKKITEAEEQSQLLDEAVLKSRPVQDLRSKIRPEIIELVKQERLHHLVQGTAFPKIGRKGRDQFFYCRLAPNHKMIHFGDTAGQTSPPLESLDKKIQVSEMRLFTGNDCPHAERGGRKGTNLLFSIYYNSEDHLDFIAPTETVYNIWIDGLSVLLLRDMPSKAAEEDVETLLNMDLKLRLLDLENVTIPSQPPSIPSEPPPNFDFYYKLD